MKTDPYLMAPKASAMRRVVRAHILATIYASKF